MFAYRGDYAAMTIAYSTTKDTVTGKVIYLLILVALNQFIYPITAWGGIYLLLFQFLYASMLVAGVVVASDTRRHMVITASTGFIYLAFGIWYALDPIDTWKVLTTYIALIPFLVTVTWVLLRYVLPPVSLTAMCYTPPQPFTCCWGRCLSQYTACLRRCGPARWLMELIQMPRPSGSR